MSAATPEMLAALRKMLTKDQGGLDLFPMGDPLLYPSNHGYFLFFNPSLNKAVKSQKKQIVPVFRALIFTL